jgi:hypothetical protein
MDLPLPRFCRAVLEWTRQAYARLEDGEDRWRQLLTTIHTPPATRALASPGRASGQGVRRAPVMTRDQQAAGFAAFQAMMSAGG